MLTDVSVKTPEAHETTGIVTFNIVGTQNTYNAAGKRVERVENAETTKFYYTGDALLYSTDAGNVLQTENILDLGGSIIASKRFEAPDEAQANEFANKYYIYNYDVRGSVTNIIGPDGNTVIGYDYDEFGNTQSSGNSAFLNDVTFTSSVADTSSSLQYMNARFYQPSTGRFISQDTYTGNPYDPWTQNLYNYCSANPVNFVDPTGHVMTLAQHLDDLKEQRVSTINEMNRLMEVRKDADPSTDYVGFAKNVKAYADAKARLKDLNQRIDDVTEKLAYERAYIATDKGPQTIEIGQAFTFTGFGRAIEKRYTLVFDRQGGFDIQSSVSEATVLPPSISPFTTYTVIGVMSAPNCSDLLDWGKFLGVSGVAQISDYLGLQLGINILETAPEEPWQTKYTGAEFYIGPTIPGSSAVQAGDTYTYSLLEKWGIKQ